MPSKSADVRVEEAPDDEAVPSESAVPGHKAPADAPVQAPAGARAAVWICQKYPDSCARKPKGYVNTSTVPIQKKNISIVLSRDPNCSQRGEQYALMLMAGPRISIVCQDP